MKDFVIKLRALFISNDWKPTYNEEILVIVTFNTKS